MFGLFSSKQNNECPIDRTTRLWMEDRFLWLAKQFRRDKIIEKPMLLPTPSDFPITYDGSKESLLRTAEIVASQMEIDINKISLDTYDQSIHEFGGDFGNKIFTQIDKSDNGGLSAGMYFDKKKNGKYEIFIENNNLNNPGNLVATLAHEFSHIKLLGEKRIIFNDELLTDLTTVIFGLGIFNANAAFKEFKNFNSFGYNSIGYLKQKEWGYALALYAYHRKEENPEWIKYLAPNIKSDFKKSTQFIHANTDKIFIEKFESER
ncbi:MAG TPA: hypothetical protein VIJ75_00815 [Hanamia sp.]